MFRTLALAIAFLASAIPAFAQVGSSKTPAQLNTEVNQSFPDQMSGAATPFNTRQTLLDIIASNLNATQLSVKSPSCGAKGDGITNDTTAIQTCITNLINAGGGTLRFPAAPSCYLITAQLLMDTSAFNNRYQNRVNIVGDGEASTCIKAVGLTVPALKYLGSTTNQEAYVHFSGFRLTGDLTLTGIGLQVNNAAYATFDHVIIEAFDFAFDTTDTDQIGWYDSVIRFNNHGIRGNPAISVTSPNNWSFYNMTVGNNPVWGIQITNANALNWNGGSIQYNGTIGGGSGQFGISLINAGDGYATVGFTNMIFEGNGGVSDIVSSQTGNPVLMSLHNVAFERTAPTTTTVTGAANNGSGAIRLAVVSTSQLTSGTIYVQGVGGVTNANSAIPWAYTIIDSTHVDLTGSTFAGVYTSGGTVSTVGFATNNLQITGTAINTIYKISTSAFRSAGAYLPDASRPTISLANTNSLILDDGSNIFQNPSEKLTYPQAQRILDDGSAWTAYTPAITSGTGAFTTTSATGRTKKVGKTIFVEGNITVTTIGTAATSMIVSLPFTTNSSATFSGMNLNNGTTMTGEIGAAGTLITFFRYDGTFPVAANGNQFIFSGTYEAQ